jgi:hypothetical protein
MTRADARALRVPSVRHAICSRRELRRGGIGVRITRLACLTAWLLAAACSARVEPAAELCAQVLGRRVPAARVLEAAAAPDSLRAAVRFDVGGSWWEEGVAGRLDCAFEIGERGSLRLRAASLDGVALTSAELTIVNVELLLADMRSADAARAD